MTNKMGNRAVLPGNALVLRLTSFILMAFLTEPLYRTHAYAGQVGDRLKTIGLPDVSDDTILRAAGRRSNSANAAMRYLPYLRNAKSILQVYSFRHRSGRRGRSP